MTVEMLSPLRKGGRGKEGVQRECSDVVTDEHSSDKGRIR